jgi:tRNA1(Val) A37 N6-methylase TrmN6
MTHDLTDDDFLDGRVSILQPRNGFRSGVDAVLLAASVPAQPSDQVLELGCGAGAASACLAARIPGLTLAGLELQETYAQLARKNADRNGMKLTVHQGDVSDPPAKLRETAFAHVIANPPYFKAGAHSPAEDPGRMTALGESAPISAWIDTGTRRLKPGGWLTIIQKSGRLRDLIAACDDRLGSLEIKPIAPRMGRQAELVILRARKGGRAETRLCAPLIMHRGDRHEADGDSYSDAATDILRNGGPLEF